MPDICMKKKTKTKLKQYVRRTHVESKSCFYMLVINDLHPFCFLLLKVILHEHKRYNMYLRHQ